MSMAWLLPLAFAFALAIDRLCGEPPGRATGWGAIRDGRIGSVTPVWLTKSD